MQAPSIDAPAADWLVYGDSLQEAGDPRGELIGLSHAVAEGKTSADVRDAYVKEHAAALLGAAAPFLASYTFDWRFCMPLGVTVRIGANDGDRDLALLDTVGLAPTLEVLDLSDSSLDDNDATFMLGRRARFAGLKKILALRTSLGDAGIKALKQLGPEIEASSGGTSYGYVVGSE